VPIYSTLEWLSLIVTFQILFCISSLGVSEELIFIFNQIREGDDELCELIVFLLISIENLLFVFPFVLYSFPFGFHQRWVLLG
jgi:hypothetical protein